MVEHSGVCAGTDTSKLRNAMAIAKLQIQAARSKEVLERQTIRHVILSGAMPEILVGLRIGIGGGLDYICGGGDGRAIGSGKKFTRLSPSPRSSRGEGAGPADEGQRKSLLLRLFQMKCARLRLPLIRPSATFSP